jgi:hypothetical protein
MLVVFIYHLSPWAWDSWAFGRTLMSGSYDFLKLVYHEVLCANVRIHLFLVNFEINIKSPNLSFQIGNLAQKVLILLLQLLYLKLQRIILNQYLRALWNAQVYGTNRWIILSLVLWSCKNWSLMDFNLWILPFFVLYLGYFTVCRCEWSQISIFYNCWKLSFVAWLLAIFNICCLVNTIFIQHCWKILIFTNLCVLFIVCSKVRVLGILKTNSEKFPVHGLGLGIVDGRR